MLESRTMADGDRLRLPTLPRVCARPVTVGKIAEARRGRQPELWKMTVDCPLCRRKTVLERQSDGAGMVFRVVRCDACRKTWDTVEKIDREIPYVIQADDAGSSVDLIQIKRNDPDQTGIISAGGRGVDLIGVGSSQIKSEIIPLALAQKTQTRARVGRGKARGQSFVYPQDFEEVLAGCEAWRGSKFAAYDKWIKNGAAPSSTICPAYAKWRESDQWRRGFVPHLSTWLNARGWEKLPNAEELAGRADDRNAPIAPPDVRREAFRAQAALAARVSRIKEDFGGKRQGAPKLAPVGDLVRQLADQKGIA